MGAVSFSIDLKLVSCLKEALTLTVFVETGTFAGDSIERVKNLFEEVHSIELSETYYNQAIVRFQEVPHVQLYHGHSHQWLRQLQSQLKERGILYWLDAHWCVAQDTAGSESQCPLLQELEAIDTLSSNSVVMIDDARLFLCPPPAPHEISHWPSFDNILKKLYHLSSLHALTIINDVIIYYPVKIEQQIRAYAYNYGIDWLVALNKSRDYDRLLVQVEEKEKQLQLLAVAAKARLEVIEKLDAELTRINSKP